MAVEAVAFDACVDNRLGSVGDHLASELGCTVVGCRVAADVRTSAISVCRRVAAERGIWKLGAGDLAEIGTCEHATGEEDSSSDEIVLQTENGFFVGPASDSWLGLANDSFRGLARRVVGEEAECEAALAGRATFLKTDE
jgi:hypothetical protein